MNKFGTFPSDSISAQSVFKLYYPQRRVDFSKAFQALNLQALGATERGTKSGRDLIDVSENLYLGWMSSQPNQGFIVFWNDVIGDLAGLTAQLPTSRRYDSQRCDLCTVQHQAGDVQFVTFRHPSNEDRSISHWMCVSLDCANGIHRPDTLRGFEAARPDSDMIATRAASAWFKLHDIYDRLTQ